MTLTPRIQTQTAPHAASRTSVLRAWPTGISTLRFCSFYSAYGEGGLTALYRKILDRGIVFALDHGTNIASGMIYSWFSETIRWAR